MKECCVLYEHIDSENKSMCVRNSVEKIYVGDKLGGSRVVKIHAYGKDQDCLDNGMTGCIWFDELPVLTIQSWNEDEEVR